MLQKILRWLDGRKSTENTPPPQDLRKTGGQQSDNVNAVIRSKREREKLTTDDQLELLDEAAVKSGAEEEDGIDPYNTGGFDRSRNWDSQFRK